MKIKAEIEKLLEKPRIIVGSRVRIIKRHHSFSGTAFFDTFRVLSVYPLNDVNITYYMIEGSFGNTSIVREDEIELITI